MSQQNTSQWTIEYAEKMMRDSANISYGVTDSEKFNQIITQKNSNDVNALYIYAKLLLDYNVINERLGMLPDQAKHEGLDIMWKLSEKNHPQACNYITNIHSETLIKQFNLTEGNLLTKKLSCFVVAIRAGERPYRVFADTLLFGLEPNKADKLLLTDTKVNNPETIKDAVNAYKKAATAGGDWYCASRLAEAYYHGFGIEKDTIKAYAWARYSAEKSTLIKGSYKTFQYTANINAEAVHNLTAEELTKIDIMYKQIIENAPQIDDDGFGWSQGRDK